MTTTTNRPTIVLIPGYWLGAWAWNEVVQRLEAQSHRIVAMTLPGLDRNDADRSNRTLDDQAAAIRNVAAQHEPVVLVAHSGANGPVSLVLDRYPELISRVVWVDSGPVANGGAFAADLPSELTELALPPFNELQQQASLAGLSADALERFRANAVPEPAGVARGSVELTNEARRRIPTTLVCCSISGAQVMELATAGHPMFAEVARLESVAIIDLPTGHWPMWSRPDDLTQIIEAEASR